jgi:hypothetical protein
MDGKSKAIMFLLSWLLVLTVAGLSYGAGQYDIIWYTVDGGGGMSSGGPYVLTGTIGQPDVAYSSSAKYQLLGGFWQGGLLCIVEFDDFARFAGYWLTIGSGLPGDFDGDSDVDFGDLARFADYWLAYCPYNWQLK